jgi:hypothetical protein
MFWSFEPMKVRCDHCQRLVDIAVEHMRQGLQCPACGKSLDDPTSQGSGSQHWLISWSSSAICAAASGIIHCILAVLLALFYFRIVDPFGGATMAVIAPPRNVEIEEVAPRTTIQTVPVEATGDGSSDQFAVEQSTISGGDVGVTATEGLPVLPVATAITSGSIAVPSLGGSVSFLGSEAQGRYFCIIADCSGSMAESDKLPLLKSELRATLDKLGGNKLVKIIFFNDRPLLYAGGAWRNVQKDRGNIEAFLADVDAEGGTEPLPAVHLALSAGRKPDVIFLMSDGEFSPIADEVLNLNRTEPRTHIETISFRGGFNAELKKIADENLGSYKTY